MGMLPDETAQHSVGSSVVLHLLPGFLAVLFYVVIAPVVVVNGFPSLFALLLAGLFVLVPFEFGHMFREAKRRTGRFSLWGIVPYREKLRFRLYLLTIPVLVFFGILIAVVLSTVDQSLPGTILSWLPNWYYFDVVFTKYSKSALIVTGVARLVLDGVVAPFMEELYFKGHLLPSISKLGRAAPPLNGFLFMAYHFWQPWNYPSILCLSLLLVYPVWWKRNVYLSLLAHTIPNFIGALPFLALVLR